MHMQVAHKNIGRGICDVKYNIQADICKEKLCSFYLCLCVYEICAESIIFFKNYIMRLALVQ